MKQKNLFLRKENIMNKKIMKVALDRLDTVITEMNMTTSTCTSMGFAGVAHDLITIINIAAGFENDKEDES